MNRTLVTAAVLGIAAAATATPVSAQSTPSSPFHLGIMGGVTKPVGDLSGFADHDWNAGAFISIGAPESPVSFRIEGQWQQIKGRTFGGCLLFSTCPSPPESHYRVADATANVVFSGVLAGPVKLYLIGGLGVYNERASRLGTDNSTTTLTKFGFNGGVGAKFQLSHFATFVEARYHNIIGAHSLGDVSSARSKSFQLVPINVGILF